MLAACGMAAGPLHFRCGLAEVSTEVVVINPAEPARGKSGSAMRAPSGGNTRVPPPAASPRPGAEMGHRPLLAEIEREPPRLVAERSGNEHRH
jgi:hypothetical protein